MVADFQDGAAPVFLLSLKAGGTGLNLTRADHVIHFDRWWNPAVEDQATDRAHRIGQTRPVQVHRLVTEGTIEQKVGQLLQRKRALAESVLGSGEAALTELSNDELRDLVSLRTARMPDPIVLPRLARARGATARSTTWWGRAFVRSFEELDPRGRPTSATARALARSGGSARSWCWRRWPRPSSTPAPRTR